MTDGLLVVGGLVTLIAGAEVLVRAGSSLAAWLGIRPMLIGLTVVSLGTSVPELAIGIDAAVSGNPGLAVGNIVGANLINFLLILGLSALLLPIALDRATLRFDLPAITAAALLLYVLARDSKLTRPDGVILLLAALAYTAARVHVSRRETVAAADGSADDAGEVAGDQRPARQMVLLLVAIVVVVIGAELLVEGAVRSARSLGVSDAIIGLTIVAVGTTAPEFVTTIMSTLRGDRDLAIGNLIGSSIYNICAILGVTVVVAPRGVAVPDEVLAADLGLLVAAAAAAVPVFLSGKRISRVEGALFVASYGGYLAWLLLTRT
jgi:cation:H+ antiporter